MSLVELNVQIGRLPSTRQEAWQIVLHVYVYTYHVIMLCA